MDPYRPTPPLSPEAAAEIIAEMKAPPADTPERRATFELARMMAAVHERSAREEARGDVSEIPEILLPDEATMNPYHLTILSPEGSAEVEEEIRNGTPLTPERRATFERMRQMEGVRKHRITPRVQPAVKKI